MHWIREGADWVLKFNRRQWPGMWRSRRADGQLSDMANLSWAKHAVLAACRERAFHPQSPSKRAPFLRANRHPCI
jgi:hypothetical protein